LLPLSKNSAFWMKKRPVRGGIYCVRPNMIRVESKKRKVSILQSWLTKLFNWTSKTVMRHTSTFLQQVMKKEEYKQSRSKNQTILDFLAVQSNNKAQIKKDLKMKTKNIKINNRDSVATLAHYDIDSEEENEEEIALKKRIYLF
jgi:hypothetical protein